MNATKQPLRVGRGRARPAALPPGAAALMDEHAARTEARRQRIREEAKNAKPTGKSQFWQRLRTARTYAQKTQRELGNELGVTRGAVALWEMEDPGHRTMPTTDQIPKIAAFLRVPMAYLMDDNVAVEDVWQLAQAGKAPTPLAYFSTAAAPTAPAMSQHALALGQLLDQIDKRDVVAFAQLYQSLTQQILDAMRNK